MRIWESPIVDRNALIRLGGSQNCKRRDWLFRYNLPGVRRGRAMWYEQLLHARGDSASCGERTLGPRRAIRRDRGERRARHRDWHKFGYLGERSHGARGSDRHSRSMPRAGHVSADWLRDLHELCLGAIYWARPDRVYFAATASDAAEAGFDDSFIYDELNLPHGERKIPFEPMMREAGLEPFREWVRKSDRKQY
jgi:hypothetical protein